MLQHVASASCRFGPGAALCSVIRCSPPGKRRLARCSFFSYCQSFLFLSLTLSFFFSPLEVPRVNSRRAKDLSSAFLPHLSVFPPCAPSRVTGCFACSWSGSTSSIPALLVLYYLGSLESESDLSRFLPTPLPFPFFFPSPLLFEILFPALSEGTVLLLPPAVIPSSSPPTDYSLSPFHLEGTLYSLFYLFWVPFILPMLVAGAWLEPLREKSLSRFLPPSSSIPRCFSFEPSLLEARSFPEISFFTKPFDCSPRSRLKCVPPTPPPLLLPFYLFLQRTRPDFFRS